MELAVIESRSNLPQAAPINAEALEKVLLQGDLSQLKSVERVAYYRSVCESVGLNPLTKPFEYIALNGKLCLYATKSCTEQLRSMQNVSLTIRERSIMDGCFVVIARASMPNGRQDESIGAVNIDGLKGENRSNAMMKAETKAKRRVTLSICGLAFLDESETDSVRGAHHVPVDLETGDIPEPAAGADLHEDIKQHPPQENAAARKANTPFNVLKYFREVKQRFQKIGREEAYYVVLKKWGVEKSNQFPATTEGIASARGCYKELQLTVADLEVAPKVLAVDALPDAVERVLGERLACQGVTYEVVDDGETYRWKALTK